MYIYIYILMTIYVYRHFWYVCFLKNIWYAHFWLNLNVMENAKLSGIVKQVFTLDPTFGIKDLDTFKLPKVNVRPDLVPELLAELPRIIYHSWTSSCLRKSLNMVSSQEGGPWRQEEPTIISLLGTPGLSGTKSLREGEPANSITSRSTPNLLCKVATASSGPTRPSSAQIGSQMRQSSASMTRTIGNSFGWAGHMKLPETGTTRWSRMSNIYMIEFGCVLPKKWWVCIDMYIYKYIYIYTRYVSIHVLNMIYFQRYDAWMFFIYKHVSLYLIKHRKITYICINHTDGKYHLTSLHRFVVEWWLQGLMLPFVP